MKNNKGFTLVELLVVIAIIGILASVVLASIHPKKASACGWFEDCTPPSAKQVERETVNATYERLANATPAPKLESSLERINISKRLTLFSDPAKISYIYLTSYGKVMAFYTVKGKITSGSKRLSSSQEQRGSCDNYQGSNCTPFESPELDGTYGSSASYIFFWTTDGTYVQWNGEYMLADQPLQLTTQPELVRSVK